MEGKINESRKVSNFIKALDEDVRKEYLVRKIAAINIDQLEPYIKITSHDKHYREIEYEIDIPQSQKAEELQAKVDGLEERNNFLERAHKTNTKIAEYAKEENQRYKQALEESYSELQKLYSRTDIPGNADIKDVLSTLEYVGLSVIKKALKGVEGCED